MRRAGMLIGFACLGAMATISLYARSSAERSAGGRVAHTVRRSAGAQARQAPQPGPEMQRLNFLIGVWDTKSEYLKSPMAPDGAKQNGWYKAQLGPGGFSVIADFEEDGPAGREIGHELLSWDPKRVAYSTVIVGNAFPGTVIGTAKWEGDDLVVSSEFGDGASAVHLRAVYVHPQGNVLQIEDYSSVGDAPFKLIYKATATKR